MVSTSRHPSVASLPETRHTVAVVPGGYLWRETTYASLSTVARAITGTAWNGHRFFGLRTGRNGPEAVNRRHEERPVGTADAGRRAVSSAPAIRTKVPR